METSNNGIGVVFMKEYEKKLYLIAYATKYFTNAKTNYSTFKGVLGNNLESEKILLFLAGKKLILQTNRKALNFSVRIVTKIIAYSSDLTPTKI